MPIYLIRVGTISHRFVYGAGSQRGPSHAAASLPTDLPSQRWRRILHKAPKSAIIHVLQKAARLAGDLVEEAQVFPRLEGRRQRLSSMGGLVSRGRGSSWLSRIYQPAPGARQRGDRPQSPPILSVLAVIWEFNVLAPSSFACPQVAAGADISGCTSHWRRSPWAALPRLFTGGWRLSPSGSASVARLSLDHAASHPH